MSYANQSEFDAAVERYSSWSLADFINDSKNVTRALTAKTKAEEAAKKAKKAMKKAAKKEKEADKQEAKAAKKAKKAEGAVAAASEPTFTKLPDSQSRSFEALASEVIRHLEVTGALNTPASSNISDTTFMEVGHPGGAGRVTYQQPGGQVASKPDGELKVVESASTDMIVTTTGADGKEVVLASTMGQTTVESAVETALAADPSLANTTLGNALANPRRGAMPSVTARQPGKNRKA